MAEEEEDIKNWEIEKVEEQIRLAELRVKLSGAEKADAYEKWEAADEKLALEQENLERLEAEQERRGWAKAFEAGKKGLGDETG